MSPTMRPRSFLTLLGAAIIVPTLAAVPAPQAEDAGGAGPPRAATVSPLQEFARKLKIDVATQGPAVNEILREASQAAMPVGREMLVIRENLINAELAGDADARQKALDAYATDAASMAGIEALTLAKICAILKPNQQANAQQAFALLAGIFQAQAPAAGGRGAGRGGGRGGARGGGQ
jgi:hypothetical protein